MSESAVPHGPQVERRQRIAVITMGVMLGDEVKGYTRFRTIAEMLVAAGYEVDLITTDFQHWEKTHRDVASFPRQRHPFHIRFIEEPGYERNVDPRRLHSHAVAARHLTRLLDSSDYDLVYCEIPPNNIARAAAAYAARRDIPFIVDVNDLWPEAMRMALDIPVISDLLFIPLACDARSVYQQVTAVVGTSDEYAARPLKDRAATAPAVETVTVYVGNDITEFDAGVRAYTAEVEKPAGEFWVTYAGTFGASYDIATLIRAGGLLKRKGYDDIRIVLLGDGPDRAALEQAAAQTDSPCCFLGYQPYDRMAAYLAASDTVVNSLVEKAPQSIPTKIGDYLASARPLINTGLSPEFVAKMHDDRLGISVNPGDVPALAAAILTLRDDPELTARLGANARRIAETEFHRPTSYRRIVELVGRQLEEAARRHISPSE
jgi:glycosyltransferase involved in cell wall biosynthesis